MMRRIIASISALLVAGAIGALVGGANSQPGTFSSSHREVRTQIVNVHLRQLDGDYLLLAGDSHIEYWLAPSLCGLPVVNAGVSGATVDDYAEFFSELNLSRRPRAIIFTLGTNDALSKRIDNPGKAVARYRRAISELLKNAAEKADSIVVIAVPPIDASRAAAYSPKIAEQYSMTLKDVCSKQGCNFVDPFKNEVSLFDGLHLSDYAETYSGLSKEICKMLPD